VSRWRPNHRCQALLRRSGKQSTSQNLSRKVSNTSVSLRARCSFFYLTHQLANYQLALTGQLSLDVFPNKILTDSQLTER